MQNTNIQWTDHTLNFWWGCTKVSRACKHCYAETVAKVFGKRLFGTVPQWGAGKPRFERLEAARKEALKIQRQAVKSGTRPRVFVNSMSDWLDDEVPLEWLAFLLETLHLCPNVDFQLLTKRPENWGVRVLAACIHMAGYRDGQISSKGPTEPEMQGVDAIWEWGKEGKAPANLWIGCTVEDQAAADARIPHLLQIPAKVRFLSCEPLVGAVDLRAFKKTGIDLIDGIDWIIAGGESGGPAEPSHPDWFRSLRDQCGESCLPFFFKQWGEWLPVNQMRYLDSNPSLARAYKGQKLDDGTLMLRVGVDTAGELLDGVQHHAFPQ